MLVTTDTRARAHTVLTLKQLIHSSHSGAPWLIKVTVRVRVKLRVRVRVRPRVRLRVGVGVRGGVGVEVRVNFTRVIG